MIHTTPVHSNRSKLKPPEGIYDEIDAPLDEPGAIGSRRGMPDAAESSRTMSSTTVTSINSSVDRSSPADGSVVRIPPPPSSPTRSRRVSRSPNSGTYRTAERSSEMEEWSHGVSRVNVGVVSPTTVPDEDEERKSSTSTVLTGANEPWDERGPAVVTRTEFPMPGKSSSRAQTLQLDYEADIETDTIDEDDEMIVEGRLTTSSSKENPSNAFAACLDVPARAIRDKLNCEFYNEEENLADGELPRLQINGRSSTSGRMGGRVVNGQVTTVRPILPPSRAGLPGDISGFSGDHEHEDDDDAPMDEMDSYLESNKRGVSTGCFGGESVGNSTTEEMEENHTGREGYAQEHEQFLEEDRDETMGETLARMINDVCSDTGTKSVGEWEESSTGQLDGQVESDKGSSVCDYTTQAVTQMDVCGNGATSAAITTPDRGTKRGLSLEKANAAAARVAPQQQENTAIEVEYVEPEAGEEVDDDDDEYEYYYEGLDDDDEDTEDVTTAPSEERTIQSSPSSSSKSSGKKSPGSRIRNFLQLGRGGGVSVVTPEGEKNKPLDRPTKQPRKSMPSISGQDNKRGRSPLSKLSSSAFIQQEKKSTSEPPTEAGRLSTSPTSPRSAVMPSFVPENSRQAFRPSLNATPTEQRSDPEMPDSPQSSEIGASSAVGTAAASLAAAVTPMRRAHDENAGATSPPSITRVLSSESLTSTSSSWSAAKKNAYLSAMRRKAKDDFQRRKAANTISPPPDSRKPESSKAFASSTTRSLFSAPKENADDHHLLQSSTSTSPSGTTAGDPDGEEYSSWSAAEKRKFLQLLSSGMSPDDSARLVKNSRSAHTPDSRERRQLEEQSGGGIKMRLGGMFAGVGGRKDRADKRHYSPIDEPVMTDDAIRDTDPTEAGSTPSLGALLDGGNVDDLASNVKMQSLHKHVDASESFEKLAVVDGKRDGLAQSSAGQATDSEAVMASANIPSGHGEAVLDMPGQGDAIPSSSFDQESPRSQLEDSAGIKHSGNYYYDSEHRTGDNDVDELVEVYSVATSAASSSARSNTRWPRKKFPFKRRTGGGGEKPGFEALDKDLERREAEEEAILPTWSEPEQQTRGEEQLVPELQHSSDSKAASDILDHQTQSRSTSEPRRAGKRNTKSSQKGEAVSIPRKRNVSAPRPGRLADGGGNSTTKKEGSDTGSSGSTSRLVRSLLRRSIGSRGAAVSSHPRGQKSQNSDKTTPDSSEKPIDGKASIPARSTEGKVVKAGSRKDELKLYLLNGSRNVGLEEKDLQQHGSDDAVVLSHDDDVNPRKRIDDGTASESALRALETDDSGAEKLPYEGVAEKLSYEGGERSLSPYNAEVVESSQNAGAHETNSFRTDEVYAATATGHKANAACSEKTLEQAHDTSQTLSADDGRTGSSHHDLENVPYFVEGEGSSFSYEGVSLSYDDREDEEYAHMLEDDYEDRAVSHSADYYDAETREDTAAPAMASHERESDEGQDVGIATDAGTSFSGDEYYTEENELVTHGQDEHENRDNKSGMDPSPTSDEEGEREYQIHYSADEEADSSDIRGEGLRSSIHLHGVDAVREAEDYPSGQAANVGELDGDENEEEEATEELSHNSVVRADPPGEIASSSSSDDGSVAPDESLGVDSDAAHASAAFTGKTSPDAPGDVDTETSSSPKSSVDPDAGSGAKAAYTDSPYTEKNVESADVEEQVARPAGGGNLQVDGETLVGSRALDDDYLLTQTDTANAHVANLRQRVVETDETGTANEDEDGAVLTSAESEEVARYLTHAIEGPRGTLQEPVSDYSAQELSEKTRELFVAMASGELRDDIRTAGSKESTEGDEYVASQPHLENGFGEGTVEGQGDTFQEAGVGTEGAEEVYSFQEESMIETEVDAKEVLTEVETDVRNLKTSGVGLQGAGAIGSLDTASKRLNAQSDANVDKSKTSATRSARLKFLSSRAARSEKDISTPKRRTRSAVRGKQAKTAKTDVVASPRSTKRSIERNFSSRGRELSQRNADHTNGINSPVRSASAKSSRKEIKPIGVKTSRKAHDDSSLSSVSKRKVATGRARGKNDDTNESKSLGDYSSSSSALSAAMLMIRRMPTWKKMENDDTVSVENDDAASVKREGVSSDKETWGKKQPELDAERDASSGTGNTVLINGGDTASADASTTETNSLYLPDDTRGVKQHSVDEGDSVFDFKDDTTVTMSGGADRNLTPLVPASVESRGDGVSKTVSSLASTSTRRTLFEVDYSDASTVSAMSMMTEAVSVKSAAIPSAGTLAQLTAPPQSNLVIRKRRPGAAQRRLIQAKEAELAASNKRGGWMESIQAAAANTNYKWDPAIGWVGYTEPETIAGYDDVSDAGRIGSLSLARKLQDREAKEQVEDKESREKREPTFVPFPAAWEKERKAMIAGVENDDSKPQVKQNDPSHFVLRDTAESTTPPPPAAIDSSQSQEESVRSASEDPLIDVSDSRSVRSDIQVLKRRRKYKTVRSQQQKRLATDGASKPSGWLQSMQAASTTVSDTDPKRRWDPVQGWQGVKAEELVDTTTPETVDFGFMASGDEGTMASVKSEGHLPSKPFLAEHSGLTVSERISRVEQELAQRATAKLSDSDRDDEAPSVELGSAGGAAAKTLTPGTTVGQTFPDEEEEGVPTKGIDDAADNGGAFIVDTERMGQEEEQYVGDAGNEEESVVPRASSVPEVQVVKTKCSEEDRGLFLESVDSENPLEPVASGDSSEETGEVAPESDGPANGGQTTPMAPEQQSTNGRNEKILSPDAQSNSLVTGGAAVEPQHNQDSVTTSIILVENAVRPSELRGKTAVGGSVTYNQPQTEKDSNSSGPTTATSRSRPEHPGQETEPRSKGKDDRSFELPGEVGTTSRNRDMVEAERGEGGAQIGEDAKDEEEMSLKAAEHVLIPMRDDSPASENKTAVKDTSVRQAATEDHERAANAGQASSGTENQKRDGDSATEMALSEADAQEIKQEELSSEQQRAPKHPPLSDSSVQISVAQGTTHSPVDSVSGRFSEETSLLYGEQVSFRTEGASAVSTPSVSSRARQWMEIIEARSKARSVDASSSSYPQSENANDSTSEELPPPGELPKTTGNSKAAKPTKTASQEWKAFLERKMLAEKASDPSHESQGENGSFVHKVHWPMAPNAGSEDQESAPMFVSAVDVDSIVMLNTATPNKAGQVADADADADDDDTIFDLDDGETNEATKESNGKRDSAQPSNSHVTEGGVASVRDRIAKEEARIRSRSTSAERAVSRQTHVGYPPSDSSNANRSHPSTESAHSNSGVSSEKSQSEQLSDGAIRPSRRHSRRSESPSKRSAPIRRSGPVDLDEVEETGDDDDSDHVFYSRTGEKGGVDNFLSRLTSCGPVLPRFENKQPNGASEVPLAHLAFLRTNPPVSRSSVVERTPSAKEGTTKGVKELVPPMLCGRPDTIVEDDREDDISSVASRQRRPSPRRSQNSTRSSSSSIVSGEIGERAAYFEAMAMRAAVGGKKVKKNPSSVGGSKEKPQQSSPSQAWQTYMARKAGSAATYISDSSTEATSTFETTDKSAAEKVEEMMEMLSVNKKSPGSKATTAVDLDDEIDERKNRVEELIDDAVLATSSRPRSRGRAPRKKSESAKAAEDLAAARVEAMMMAMSSEKLDEGEI